MPRYRKRPVVIEAAQWLPQSNGGFSTPPAPENVLRQTTGNGWQIRTLEGWLDLTPGDWIIRGVAGEHYPCKPDVFSATYEKVEE